MRWSRALTTKQWDSESLVALHLLKRSLRTLLQSHSGEPKTSCFCALWARWTLHGTYERLKPIAAPSARWRPFGLKSSSVRPCPSMTDSFRHPRACTKCRYLFAASSECPRQQSFSPKVCSVVPPSVVMLMSQLLMQRACPDARPFSSDKGGKPASPVSTQQRARTRCGGSTAHGAPPTHLPLVLDARLIE